MRCRALQDVEKPTYLGGFLCSGLRPFAPYCARRGITMVSGGRRLRVVGSTNYERSAYVPPQRLGDAGAYQKENRSSRGHALQRVGSRLPLDYAHERGT